MEKSQFSITPVPNMVPTKPAYLMTSNEYQEDVVPYFVELKAILRKKFFLAENSYDFEFFTRDGLLAYAEQKSKYAKEDLLNLIDKKKIKDTPAPKQMLDRFSTLLGLIISHFEPHHSCHIMRCLKSNKSLVRDAMDYQYLTDIANRKFTLSRVQEICDSLEIRVPKRLLDLKTIDEAKNYREMSPLSKEFYDKLQAEITPFRIRLNAFRKDQIDTLLKSFPTKLGDNFTKNLTKKIIKSVGSSDFAVLCDIAHLGYDKTVELECKKHVINMLSKFIRRMEENLSNINTRLNVVEIKFHHTTFSAGIIETVIWFTYDNNENITCESSLIIAGGHIQRLHYRYLTNFFYKGKRVSQYELDNLFT